MEHKAKQEFSLDDLKAYATLILLSVAVVAILAIFTIFVYPNTIVIKESWSKISQNEEQISMLENKLAILTTLNQKDLRDAIERSQQFLPVENEVFEIMGYFSARAIEANVSLGDFQVVQSELGGSGELPLDLDIKGTLKELFNFNKILIDSARVLSIDSLNLDFTSKESSLSAVLTQSISLVNVSEPFLESIGTVTDKLPQLSVLQQELLAEIQLTQWIKPQDTAPEFTARENPFSL